MLRLNHTVVQGWSNAVLKLNHKVVQGCVAAIRVYIHKNLPTVT